jgi:hypothetical protein
MMRAITDIKHGDEEGKTTYIKAGDEVTDLPDDVVDKLVEQGSVVETDEEYDAWDRSNPGQSNDGSIPQPNNGPFIEPDETLQDGKNALSESEALARAEDSEPDIQENSEDVKEEEPGEVTRPVSDGSEF